MTKSDFGNPFESLRISFDIFSTDKGPEAARNAYKGLDNYHDGRGKSKSMCCVLFIFHFLLKKL